jgi:hypothetical protein
MATDHALLQPISALGKASSPPPCPRCRARCWWNGWRVVFVAEQTAEGDCKRRECRRHRAKCSDCQHGFTCYEPGHYPRRQFQLDVVAHVTARMAFEGTTPRVAGATAGASPSSARRWTAWVAELAQPAELLRVAAELEPEAPATPGTATLPEARGRRGLLARVLDALERLGACLVRRGAELGSRFGLGRVLEWQHRTHGEVVGLVAEPRTFHPRAWSAAP